jgi:DNA polymerase
VATVDDQKQAQLEKLTKEIQNLEQSPLYEYREQHDFSPVVGEGDPYARIVFVGEAPGKKEAETGRPFVGAAGRILDELLASIELKREEVYITNVVKDRPPENRDPRTEEIQLYGPLLIRQLEIIQPEVIATLGRFAMNFILEQFNRAEADEKISDLHGQPIEAKASYGKVTIIPLFHPAFALYAPDRKDTLKEDFQKLKPYVN